MESRISMFTFILRWFNYLVKRNLFLNQREEEKYIQSVFCKYGIVPFENYLLKIVPKKECIYVEMKSRGCGYIFEMPIRCSEREK